MANLEVPLEDISQISSIFDKIVGSTTTPEPVVSTTEVPVISEPEKKNEEPVKKVEEKPVSTASEDLPEELPNAGRSDAWKKFRTAHKETLSQVDTLKAQLSEFEGTRKERDELKAKISEFEERQKELEKIDSLSKLENLPDFRSKYVDARNSAMKKIDELAGYSDIDPADIRAALAKTGKERYAALEDVLTIAPSITKSKIVGLIDQIESIDVQRQEELANAQESLKRRQEDQEKAQRQQEEEQTKRLEETFQKTSSQLGKELGIDPSAIDKARDFYMKNNDIAKAAEIILKATHFDATKEEREKLAKEVEELRADNARLRGASPGLGSGGGANIPASKTESFLEGALRAGKGL